MRRDQRRSFRTVVIAALGAALSASAAFAARTPLIYNEDDSHVFKRAETCTPEALAKYLDSVADGGKVTHFFMCVNAQRANFPSRVMEPAWAPCDVPGWKQTSWSVNLKALNDRGIDPYRIWIDRCRAKKVSPWISFRMNDGHCVNDLTYGGHSRFWREHPEFWTEPNSRDWNQAKRALDYAHREVREYMIAFIKETLERYDVDGIECDWMRFTQQLTFGHERELSQCLDEFMHRVRELVRAAEKRLGHRVQIAARVDSRPEKALNHGTDPFTWARRGDVDLVIACNFFNSADFELPIDDWTKRLAEANPQVLVLPGLDISVTEKGKGRRFLTVDEYCGWADRMYSRGAKGVYLFNLFENTDDVRDFILHRGLDRETVAAHSKSIPAGAQPE